jgi:transcriptional regulator with XRE-family HTH domain
MANKRTYKVLSKSQTTKVRSLTHKGKTQAQIAKVLGVSKQRVATTQRAAKVGKRRPSPFWKAVKQTKEAAGISHKEATRTVYHAPKWGIKRHGAGYIPPQERWQAMKDKRAEFDKDKLSLKDKEELAEYGESIGLGDTPK